MPRPAADRGLPPKVAFQLPAGQRKFSVVAQESISIPIDRTGIVIDWELRLPPGLYLENGNRIRGSVTWPGNYTILVIAKNYAGESSASVEIEASLNNQTLAYFRPGTGVLREETLDIYWAPTCANASIYGVGLYNEQNGTLCSNTAEVLNLNLAVNVATQNAVLTGSLSLGTDSVSEISSSFSTTASTFLSDIFYADTPWQASADLASQYRLPLLLARHLDQALNIQSAPTNGTSPVSFAAICQAARDKNIDTLSANVWTKAMVRYSDASLRTTWGPRVPVQLHCL